MGVYLVTWDLNRHKPNYAQARQNLVDHMSRYPHIKDEGLDSVWFIQSTSTADALDSGHSGPHGYQRQVDGHQTRERAAPRLALEGDLGLDQCSHLATPALGMFEWLKYLASGLSFATAVTLFFRWRDYERKKAAGSTLTVTDGVDRRNVRWAKLNLRSWTASPIRIGRLRVLWPLGLGGYAYTDEDSVKAIMIYDRSIEPPEGCRSIVITPPAEIPESNSLRLTFFVKADQSLRQSAATIAPIRLGPR